QQRLGVDTVKDFLDDRGERDVGQDGADEHAGHQREWHGHAEIAEEQEADRHQRENDGGAHGRTPSLLPSTIGIVPSSSGGSGWSKPLRRPLTSCSMVNSAISTPEIGMIA